MELTLGVETHAYDGAKTGNLLFAGLPAGTRQSTHLTARGNLGHTHARKHTQARTNTLMKAIEISYDH